MTPDAHRHLLLVTRCELPQPLLLNSTMHDGRRRARLKVGERHLLYPQALLRCLGSGAAGERGEGRRFLRVATISGSSVSLPPKAGQKPWVEP